MVTLTALAPAADGLFRRLPAPGRLRVHAVITLAVFGCYILSRLLDGPASTAFAVAGVGACGWAWLLTRALFDPSPHDARWPRVAVAVLVVTGAIAVAAPVDSGIARLADSAYAISGSAALLLTFVEPLNRYRGQLSSAEKRFRLIYLAVYASLVAIAVLGLSALDATPADAWRNDLVRAGCAIVSLGAVLAAVWFRHRHPLVLIGTPPSAKRPPTAEDRRLAERLLRLLRDDGIDAEPDLRIGDVAARLGQPEYKVSQCISAALGFPNFNRLINHHRIERAKGLLADAGGDRPILDIAFECGFGSVGPFNRAFKDETGTTPRAFRAASRRSMDAGGLAGPDQ